MKLASLPILLLILAAFFLPLLLGWERVFYDDIAFIFYPQQVFLASAWRAGGIAWWDPHVCAGASVFCQRFFQASLYPLNWPFLAAAPLGPEAAYRVLVQLPLVLHFLLAGLFAWLFARLGLGLSRTGSVALALAYALSPSLTYMSTFPPEVFIQAFLPFFCFCILRFVRSGGAGWLIAGAAAFGLSSPSGDVPYVFQTVLVGAVFAAGWAILCAARSDRRGALRALIAPAAIFAIGALLAGVYWSNMIDGILLIAASGGEEAVGLLSGTGQSLCPPYLVTLLVPDFFGGVASDHTWGAAFRLDCSLNDANLLGGLAAVFAVVAGLYLARRREEGRGERGAFWLFAGIFVLGLFVVLGAYTPVFPLLRRFIPVFRLPYPVRFRTLECFAFSGLLGASLSLLSRSRRRLPPVLLAPYLLLAAAAGGCALLLPCRDGGKTFATGIEHLRALGDLDWFLRRPALYFLVASLALIVARLHLGERRFRTGLAVLVVLEILLFAYPAFYRNRVLNRRHADLSAERWFGPSDHPAYRVARSWDPPASSAGGLFRRGYFRSYLDQLAWVNGSFSILGFDVKPLDERFSALVADLAPGLPYELRPRDWGSRFWTNMSVRDVLLDREDPPPGARPAGGVGPFFAYELSAPLPRFHFQDRWTRADSSAEREALLHADLRAGGFIAPAEAAGLPEELFSAGREAGSFADLQASDAIVSRETSGPNRVSLGVALRRPALLVATDVWRPDWRATVDGRPERVRRVNYLQRGIFCPAGEHRVEMVFEPASLSRGWLFTGLGAAALLVLVAARRRSGRRG